MVITLIGIGLSYSGVMVRSKFAIGLIEKLRNIMRDKLLKSEYEYFENESSGSMSNRILRDMNAVADYMSGGLTEFLSNMVVFVCCFMYLLTVNLSMTLVSAICIPLAVALAKRVAAIFMRHFRRIVASLATIVIYLIPMFVFDYRITLIILTFNILTLTVNTHISKKLKGTTKQIQNQNGKPNRLMSLNIFSLKMLILAIHQRNWYLRSLTFPSKKVKGVAKLLEVIDETKSVDDLE